MKEVQIQVKYLNGGSSKTVAKTYSGIKNTITLEQTAALARFFQQLTNDMVVSAYRITKEDVDIEEWGENSGRFENCISSQWHDNSHDNSAGRKEWNHKSAEFHAILWDIASGIWRFCNNQRRILRKYSAYTDRLEINLDWKDNVAVICCIFYFEGF